MAVGCPLPVKQKAVTMDDIFLAEHGKEQGILLFVVKSADTLRYGGE